MADQSRKFQGGDVDSGDLKADMARLRNDLKELKNDMASMGSAHANDARASLKEGLSAAEVQARAAVDTATTELQEIQRQAESAVKKKPLTAIAAALAIGYFIGGIARK